MNIPQWAVSLLFAVVWFVAIATTATAFISWIAYNFINRTTLHMQMFERRAFLGSIAWAILIVYWFN